VTGRCRWSPGYLGLLLMGALFVRRNVSQGGVLAHAAHLSWPMLGVRDRKGARCSAGCSAGAPVGARAGGCVAGTVLLALVKVLALGLVLALVLVRVVVVVDGRALPRQVRRARLGLGLLLRRPRAPR